MNPASLTANVFGSDESLRTNSSAGQEAKKDRKKKRKKERGAGGGNGRKEGNSLWEKRYMASGLESISHRV